MAPKKLDTDPALEQLQQEVKQMSTTLMEQWQEGDRVKSLELAVGALQRSFDSTLSFLEPMRQQYLEGEEDKRRLMEMMKGKMHQIEESAMEEDGDGDRLFGGGERSTVGFASSSTVKEPGGRSTEKEGETTVVEYLSRRKQVKNKDLERRKITHTSFAVSGYASTEGRQGKPFNPPLGETSIHTLRYVPGEIMAPKKLDTDPALEQLQQEGKQMSTTLMEQRQEGDRVKSLELAVGALQRSFDSTLSFLEPMRQQYLEGEEEKRRLMEMMKGKMHQIEKSAMEEDGDGEGLFGGGERSAVGFAFASTVKEPGGRSTEKEGETTVVLDPVGVLTLKFDDGETYEWSKVTTSIYNITLGKLYCDHYGTMRIKGGGNYSCRLKFKEQSVKDRNPRQRKRTKKSSLVLVNHISGSCVFVQDNRTGEKVAILIGKWDEAIQSPTKTRYNLSPFAISLNEITLGMMDKLPSTDSRLRPDQRHLENGEYHAAKLRLEQLQGGCRRKDGNRAGLPKMKGIIDSHSDLLEVFSNERFNELFEDDGIFNADHESWKEQRRIIITEI
ncbi:hypothetical protein DY000_02045348 [Brassica cretica]|uniref:Uncharacterized protein n=1 Tax=Brassica cretica TaxID=69181 RepID=A0ABQ7F2J9_BRACR|nr:hypothetical protein DY000_02045348 [Brassica cretica]